MFGKRIYLKSQFFCLMNNYMDFTLKKVKKYYPYILLCIIVDVEK